jgi:aspartyl-tRNA(Asn)/glutamyl-tRNA(Gln) amidotransferase subunit A
LAQSLKKSEAANRLQSEDRVSSKDRPTRRDFLVGGVAAAASFAVAEGRVEGLARVGVSPPVDKSDLTALTLKEASELLKTRSVSPVELTQACLTRIERLNGSLNAFITVVPERALADAREMLAEQQRGKWRGPLHGVPIALKDNIDTSGVRTTGASELFKDRVPTEDAEVARRLKNAGAVLLGKLNLHEFAYGGSSTVTYFGTMHNPWALDRVTGGSSGGPGVAVAAGLCYGSLGTDTAGSVRMPAAHCGIVGFKPTYGRVSTRGVMTLSWTLDHVGPMCRTVEDAALLLNIVAGYDDLDPTTADVPVPDYTRALRMPTSRLRLGIPRRPFYDTLDPDVARATDEAIEVLRKLTAGIRDVQLPATPNPATVWTPEAYVYHTPWITESPEKYQPSTRASVQRGAEAKAADYVRARRQVEVLRREIKSVFKTVDLLITPTMKTPPPLIGAPGAAGGGGNNNAAFDIFGLPTISIPCGISSGGLPIGLQISGAPFGESTVLSLAQAYERATEWHTRKPKV